MHSNRIGGDRFRGPLHQGLATRSSPAVVELQPPAFYDKSQLPLANSLGQKVIDVPYLSGCSPASHDHLDLVWTDLYWIPPQSVTDQPIRTGSEITSGDPIPYQPRLEPTSDPRLGENAGAVRKHPTLPTALSHERKLELQSMQTSAGYCSPLADIFGLNSVFKSEE